MIEIDFFITAKLTKKSAERLTNYLEDNSLDLDEFVNSDAHLIEFLNPKFEPDVDSEIEVRSVINR